MQRTLNVEREISVSQETESFCLVCKTNLNSALSTNIFYASLPRYGELLASFVLRVLRPVASDLRSSYICVACHDLFRALEQAQWTVSNVRSEILKIYHSRETSAAQQRKIKISSDRASSRNYTFNESSEDEKNRLIDIAEFRSLDAARNEFETFPIDNLELTSELSVKRDIEDSLAITKPEEYKLNDLAGESHAEKCPITRNGTMNCEKIDSRLAPEVPGETTEIASRENRVEVVPEVPNEFSKNVTRAESDNGPAIIPEISNELLKDSSREESKNAREIISQISQELQKNSAPRSDESANAREMINEISSTLMKNLDAEVAKKSLYTLQCGVCSRLFGSSKDLQSHALTHAETRPYRCRECGERFAEYSSANDHASEFHSSVKNCISVSGAPSASEIANSSNGNWIFSEDRRVGEIKDSAEVAEFGRGAIDDSSDRDAALETNSEKKVERPSWKSGRISKYSLKPLKYSCSTCGKKWRTSAELKTHVKSHSNLRPYMCEKCGQAYKHKHALEIHVGMHNGVSPFQCSVCNKCFTQKGALMRHLPMHTGETPYQCELCGKRFVHHTSYNMHALSHTGKKSFRCHVCDLSLLSTSHLKRHMRVHTGEKPYSCTLCGKSFAERYNLFAHQKIHDPVEIMAKAAKKMTYKCERCDEYFDKKQKLEEHTKDRHNNSTSSNDNPTNGRKWIGHTIEVENPPCENGSLIEQSWQDLDYAKLQSVAMKAAQNESQLSQLSHESIAMLMSQTNYNKGMSVVIQSTNSTINAEIDQTQI